MLSEVFATMIVPTTCFCVLYVRCGVWICTFVVKLLLTVRELTSEKLFVNTATIWFTFNDCSKFITSPIPNYQNSNKTTDDCLLVETHELFNLPRPHLTDLHTVNTTMTYNVSQNNAIFLRAYNSHSSEQKYWVSVLRPWHSQRRCFAC